MELSVLLNELKFITPLLFFLKFPYDSIGHILLLSLEFTLLFIGLKRIESCVLKIKLLLLLV